MKLRVLLAAALFCVAGCAQPGHTEAGDGWMLVGSVESLQTAGHFTVRDADSLEEVLDQLGVAERSFADNVDWAVDVVLLVDLHPGGGAALGEKATGCVPVLGAVDFGDGGDVRVRLNFGSQGDGCLAAPRFGYLVIEVDAKIAGSDPLFVEVL